MRSTPLLKFTLRSLVWLVVVMSVASLKINSIYAQPSPGVSQAPAELESYIDLAIKQNPDMMAERSRYDESNARANQATSALFPKIDLNGNYTHFTGGRVITLPGLGTFSTASIAVIPWDNNVSANWNVFNWAIWEAPQAAKAYLAAANYSVSAKELGLALQVAQAYYGYASATELVAVRQNAVDLAKQNYSTTQSLFKADKAQKNDVLRADVAVASAEGDVLTAKNLQNLARTNFNNLLKRDYDAPIDLPANPGETMSAIADGAKNGQDLASNSDLQPMAQPTSLTQDMQQAMVTRPEIAELSESREAVEGLRSVSFADNIPNISVFARYGYQENSPTFSSMDHYFMTGATLHWNLFSGFNTKAKVAENDAQIEEIEFQKESAVNNIRVELQNARLTLDNARERRIIATKQLQSAEENRRITKAQYDQGVVPLITMIDAETTLANSKANLTTTTYDVLTAEAAYRKALGLR